MNAKELHDQHEIQTLLDAIRSGLRPNWGDPIQVGIIERALSLLAAVEDGDEIVQRLNQMIEPGKPGFIRSNLERREAAARIVSDAQEIAALKAAGDGDEIVQRLKDEQLAQVLMGNTARAKLQGEAAARITLDAQEIAALKGEIEAANLCATVAEKEVIRVKADLAARDAELAAMKQGKVLADGMANMIRGFILKTVERETLDEAAAKYRKWEEDYCHSTPAKLDRAIAAEQRAEAAGRQNDDHAAYIAGIERERDEWKLKAEESARDAGRLTELWIDHATAVAIAQHLKPYEPISEANAAEMLADIRMGLADRAAAIAAKGE